VVGKTLIGHGKPQFAQHFKTFVEFEVVRVDEVVQFGQEIQKVIFETSKLTG
jgi:hypothetical protein